MDTSAIYHFLNQIAKNNHREWMDAHREEYQACRRTFETLVQEALNVIAPFDNSISALRPKDCIFRFNRDTRFSPDKSPYKRHFGAYISAHGRKALHGGYYIHLQPGQTLLAVGAYWLPTPILTAMRTDMMARNDEWRKAVENPAFLHFFGKPNEGQWSDDEVSPKGFGLTSLKTIPRGFPKDWPHPEYLRMKDFAAWHVVEDNFFEQPNWQQRMADIFQTAKPMMDFTNSVIDDYE